MIAHPWFQLATDMLDTVEFAKIVGSISGIFSAAFLVWDRYTKHYPVAVLIARPLVEGSQTIVPILWIKNFTSRPVLITWNYQAGSNLLGLAKNDSVRSVVDSVFPGEKEICLGPHADIYLKVIRPNRFDEIDPNNSIEVRLRWRFAQPLLWKADRPMRVWIRKRDFDSMLENYVAPIA